MEPKTPFWIIRRDGVPFLVPYFTGTEFERAHRRSSEATAGMKETGT